jgi:hypothetical protein
MAGNAAPTRARAGQPFISRRDEMLDLTRGVLHTASTDRFDLTAADVAGTLLLEFARHTARRSSGNSRVRPGMVFPTLSLVDKGTVGEILVAAALDTLGETSLTPWKHPYDLELVRPNGTVNQIEVRTGYETSNGSVFVHGPTIGKADICVVVTATRDFTVGGIGKVFAAPLNRRDMEWVRAQPRRRRRPNGALGTIGYTLRSRSGVAGLIAGRSVPLSQLADAFENLGRG